jgi:tetratricopeptide (TPR) repeat protein
MKLRNQVLMTVAVALFTFVLWTGVAIAKPETPALSQPTPTPTLSNPFWEKLEILRQDEQLQKLVQEDLEKSLVIREQIQTEVDRAFGHTTTILNVLLVLLTSFPILAAFGIWFMRRSVISQIITETKKQLQDEVEKQLEEEVAAEFKKQTDAFKQETQKLHSEFVAQLSELKNLVLDAQREKDRIIEELSKITPSPVREPVPPEIQHKIQELTKHLELLKSANPQLFFTANDYVEQGKALYIEGRYEEAIAFQDKAIQIEPDNARAWFSKGASLTKLQHYENAIAAYDQVTLKLPDFYLAWFGKARCYAWLGSTDLALDNLEKAIQLNSDKCREAAKTDLSFDKVRNEERFNQLIDS